MEYIKQTTPDYPVNINVVNNGKIFGDTNWYTFYCGNCNNTVYGHAKECTKCGAILQHKEELK